MQRSLKLSSSRIFGLAFAAFVAADLPLHAAESASPIPVEHAIPAAAPKADLPAVLTQEEPLANPSDTALDTTVEIEIRSAFNDLRRELLDDRMKLVDWWLAVMAVFLTLVAVVAPIAGFFGFKRFREIEIEARKGVDTTNAATEEAKSLVREIKSKRDEAVSHAEQITSMTVVKEPSKAKEAAQSAIENPPTSQIDRAIIGAILLQQQGDIKGAARKWRAVAEIADGIDVELGARAWFSVGYLCAEESDFEEAVDGYDEAIRLKPDFAEALNNRGVAKSGLGRHDEALADYDEAIRLKPDFAEALNNRGVAKSGLGRHGEALADYDEAIRLNPDYAEAFSNRGAAKSDLGRHGEALADYDEAIRLNPNDAKALNNRGNAKSGLGRHDEALADYDEAIRLNPDNALFQLMRAKTRFNLGQLDEARNDLEKAQEMARATADEALANIANQIYGQLFGDDNS